MVNEDGHRTSSTHDVGVDGLATAGDAATLADRAAIPATAAPAAAPPEIYAEDVHVHGPDCAHDEMGIGGIVAAVAATAGTVWLILRRRRRNRRNSARVESNAA